MSKSYSRRRSSWQGHLSNPRPQRRRFGIATGSDCSPTGPFAETREQLGGYTIIEADDLDDAIAIASGFLGTSTRPTIEIRPIVDFEGVPATPENR